MDNVIIGLDFIAVPSKNADELIKFYTETLGLRPDDTAKYEFWIGDTCFGIWEPDKVGMPEGVQKNGHIAMRVDDIKVAKTELEKKGVAFPGEIIENPVCFMALFSDPDGNDLMLHQVK